MSTLITSPRLAFLKKDSYMTRLVIVFILLLIFFAAVRPGPFFAVRTWQSMAVQFPEFGLMSLGVMFTMFTAGIDLSVVAIANVTSICAALTLRATLASAVTPSSMMLAALIALGVALGVGILCGLINGLLVAVLKIPPILATLGTLELFGGVALILTQGKPVSGVPPAFGAVFSARVAGIVPVPLLVFLVCALVAGFIVAFTGFGTTILMLQVLSSGLNMFPAISNFYRPLIWGGVLLLVICMNEGLFSWTKLRHLVKGRAHADN